MNLKTRIFIFGLIYFFLGGIALSFTIVNFMNDRWTWSDWMFPLYICTAIIGYVNIMKSLEE